MATNRTEIRNIQFGIKGMEDIYAHQNKIAALAKKALDAQKEILKATQAGTKAYEQQEALVKRMEKEYNRWKTDANKLQQVLQDPANASAGSIMQTIKAIEKGMKTIGGFRGADGMLSKEMVDRVAEYGELMRQLKAIYNADMQGVKTLTEGLRSNQTAYTELDAIVKIYEKDGRALAASQKDQVATFAKMGQTATEAKLRMAELDGTIVSISKSSSKEGLEKTAAWFKNMQSYAGASAEQVKVFGEKYRQTMSVLAEKNMAIVASPKNHSVNEVQESVKWMQEYLRNTTLSEAQQKRLNSAILQGTTYIKEFGEKAQYDKGGAVWKDMASQLQNIKGISKEALTEQQKYWQAIQDKAKATSQEYETAKVRLQSVNEELARRKTLETQQQGKSIAEQINAGIFKGTIKETQQAIEKLKEYRATLHADNEDAAKIKEVDAAISTLSGNLAKVREDVMAGKAALEQFGNETNRVSALEKEGAEGLAKMRANLEAYKKSLKGTGAIQQLKRVEEMITDVDRAQKNLNIHAIEWSKFKGGELQKRSLTELRAAYDALKKHIEAMSPAQQEYNEKAMQMRMIDKQVKELNKSMGHHVSSLENAASRLKNYVMIYLGFNAIMSKTRALIGDAMKLSDAMANVEKVTNMSSNEVARLTKSLQELDTRTATEKLMEYAEQAGKLGVYTENGLEGMKQFVEMGDRIGRTLGEDIGGAQAIADLAKVNDIMKVTARTMARTGDEATVMRDALNATGSAILNVGNNSAASYGPVVEYVGRLGAISATSNMAMEETIALGATLDALKMPAEAGSTALQQFIAAVRRNADGMAEAAGVSVKTMRELVNNDMYKALTLLFSQVNKGVASSQDLMNAMTGRQRSNANMRSVIELLSGNLDLLNRELGYAKEGFESAFSSKTAGDIQMILSAMRGMGKEGSIESMLEMFKQLRSGNTTFGTLAKQLAGTTYNLGMMQSAVENVYTAMGTLDAEGRLTAESMEALATSTGALSVMEKEFERVNDSAAAQFEKFSKMMHDTFVNSEAVEWLGNVGKGLMDFIEWLNKGSAGARVFGTAVVALTTYIVVLKTRLQELVFVELIGRLRAWGTAVISVVSNIKSLTAAWNALKVAMSTNWLGLILTALAGLVYWLKSANDEATRFAKATAKATEQLHDERMEAALLFAQLKNLNLTNEERRRLIDTINSKYGKLIGYMIDENTTARKLANTYDLVNAKLREKANLQLQEILMEKATEGANEKIAKGISNFAEQSDLAFGGDYKKSAEFQTKVQAAIQKEIAKNPYRTTNEILEAVRETVGYVEGTYSEKNYEQNKSWFEKIMDPHNVKGARIGRTMSMRNDAYIREIIDGMKESAIAMNSVSAYMAGQEKGEEELSNQAYRNKWSEIIKEVNPTLEAFRDNRSSVTDEELYTALQSLFILKNDKGYENALRDYESGLGNNENNTIKFNTSSALANINYFIREMTKEQQARNKITPWGDKSTEGKEMEDWTTKSLQDYLKKIEESRRVAAKNADWGQIFPDLTQLIPGMSKEEVEKVLDEEAEKVRGILKSRHWGAESPDHRHDKDNSSKEKQEIKQEMEASLAKLEEYYERRQMMAEKALNNGMIGEDEYNRYLFANEQEHLIERQNLRKKWLKDDEQFMTKGVEELMSDVDFKKLSKFLTDKGKAMTDGIKLNIAKDENAFEKNIRENREKIEKILLDERPIAKIANAFVSDLADLRVLWNDGTEAVLQDSEAAQKEMIEKMSFLMNEAKKGYALTSEELIKDMVASGNPLLIEWAKQLNTEDNKAALNAIVLKTQGFFDEYEDAVRKMINKIEKRVKFDWERTIGEGGLSREQMYGNLIKNIEDSRETQSMFDSWGLTGYGVSGRGLSDDLEMAWLNKKLEKETELYELMKKRMDEEYEAILRNAEAAQLDAENNPNDPQKQALAVQLFQEAEAMKQASIYATAEAYEKVKQAQADVAKQQVKEMDKTYQMIKPYYDNLMTFAKDFGANIFGKKEDRKLAARELAASLIETLGNMLTQWAVYYATKNLYEQNSVATSLALQGTKILSETAMDGVKVGKDAAVATANEVKSKGWAGLATGAALTVILTALFAAAAAKVRGTVASETGKGSAGPGKLATGMLTYANGRYPTYSDGTMSVQGNDGNTYNATYKPNLSTGEYRTPHLGIVGEKGAELIVDSPTYKNLQRYRPDILDDIYRIHRYGTRRVDWGETARRGNEVLARRAGVRTFADGNIDDVLTTSSMGDNSTSQDSEIKETLERLNRTLRNIQDEGIAAYINMFGDNGLGKAFDKGNKFLRRLGLS